jgi:hypothetical protein
MRRAIRIGSVVTLLAFAGALAVMLIPQPCAPATPGSRFYICIPPGLVEGILLALVAATLATLVGLVGLIHSVITHRYSVAALLGIGLLVVAPGSLLAAMRMLMLIAHPVFNLSEMTALAVSLALLAIITAPLLAIATLRYSGAPSPRECTPAEKAE